VSPCCGVHCLVAGHLAALREHETTEDAEDSKEVEEHAKLANPQQGLTLVHLSAQLERFVRDRGCAYGVCSPCEGGVRGCL